MLFKEETPLGYIEFDSRLIVSIARQSLHGLGDSIMLSGARGRLKNAAQKKGSEDDSFIDIRVSKGRLDIQLYLILRFGKSIEKTAGQIDSALRRDIRALSGLEVGRLAVRFVGIVSKNLSKRNIEVTTDAY